MCQGGWGQVTFAANRGPGNLGLGFPAGLRWIISPKKTLCPFSKGGLAFERGAVRPGGNHAALTSWTPWARPQIRPPPEPPEDGGLRPSAHSQPCPVLPHKQTCARRTQTSKRLIYAFNTASFI